MTLDSAISALTGLLATAVGAGIVWGVARAKIDMIGESLIELKRDNKEEHATLWSGLGDTEARCKERDGKIERDLAHTRTRLDAHLDQIATRSTQP
jgi:hypothetical protein